MRRIVAGLSIVALSLVGSLNVNVLAQAGGTAAKPAAKPAAAKTANGVVKTVSATSLVITSGGKDMTFAVDGTTSVVATGASSKSAAAGGKVAITDVVSAGNQVRVMYHDMGGMMHAQSVRVTAKAK